MKADDITVSLQCWTMFSASPAHVMFQADFSGWLIPTWPDYLPRLLVILGKLQHTNRQKSQSWDGSNHMSPGYFWKIMSAHKPANSIFWYAYGFPWPEDPSASLPVHDVCIVPGLGRIGEFDRTYSADSSR